jgi:hypothetical protein
LISNSNFAEKRLPIAKILPFSGRIFFAIESTSQRVHREKIFFKLRVLYDDLSNLVDKFLEHFPKEIITWVNYDIPILYDEIIALIRNSHGELNFKGK